MRNNPPTCFFTHFSCGLFGFDIEWKASNSSAQSTKGNLVILMDKICSQKEGDHLNIEEFSHFVHNFGLSECNKVKSTFNPFMEKWKQTGHKVVSV